MVDHDLVAGAENKSLPQAKPLTFLCLLVVIGRENTYVSIIKLEPYDFCNVENTGLMNKKN